VGVYYRRFAPSVGCTDREMGRWSRNNGEWYVQIMGDVVMLLVKESGRKQTPELKAALRQLRAVSSVQCK
jgi:hypothetical protein